MTTKEQLNDAREKYYEAYGNYIKTVKEVVAKERGLYLKDEDSDEDGKPVRIRASDLDHNYVYSPSFDQINTEIQICERGRIVFIFHVVDGDGLFPDNTWVSEDAFADDSWEELLEWIVFPEH